MTVAPEGQCVAFWKGTTEQERFWGRAEKCQNPAEIRMEADHCPGWKSEMCRRCAWMLTYSKDLPASSTLAGRTEGYWHSSYKLTPLKEGIKLSTLRHKLAA